MSAEHEFTRSEEQRQPNFAILVLELGRLASLRGFPENIPDWLKDACIRYHKLHEAGRNVMTKSGGLGGGYALDAIAYELAADLKVDPEIRRHFGCSTGDISDEMALRTAISVLYKKKAVESDIKRLRVKWGDLRDSMIEEASIRHVRNMHARHNRTLNDQFQERLSTDDWLKYLNRYSS